MEEYKILEMHAYIPDCQVNGTLTVNSPVTASKPTWMVCSKSEGRDISGRSFSFFLFATAEEQKQITQIKQIFMQSKLVNYSLSRKGDVWREMLTLVSTRKDGAQTDFLVFLFRSHWKWFRGVIH